MYIQDVGDKNASQSPHSVRTTRMLLVSVNELVPWSRSHNSIIGGIPTSLRTIPYEHIYENSSLFFRSNNDIDSR